MVAFWSGHCASAFATCGPTVDASAASTSRFRFHTELRSFMLYCPLPREPRKKRVTRAKVFSWYDPGMSAQASPNVTGDITASLIAWGQGDAGALDGVDVLLVPGVAPH